ncbi:cell division protein FtsX [Paenibacillus mucilaginosus]|uniref:cell division protein FtsX n=1 Tax=Paenibacillus mucilaginosus TaxID=61624 RepID=UPI0002DF6036|nr:permease-like cell division protein FtsX [Paenibacillus mucilaginosus]MCG7211880.1 permease-like cell division protein FtsX [Paenibacillus mucilaginosus]WDM25119.1 permease-like cell division protein FtsX [Paenibacillus mucilaginosus]
MRWNLARYYLRDARDGFRRSPGASLAAVLLITITLTAAGTLFLLRSGVQEVIGYLESQVKIKLMIDPAADAEPMAELLRGRSWVRSAEIETKEMSLQRLQKLFDGKEHLFRAFEHSNSLPDLITLELAEPAMAPLAAEELEGMKGVTEVIFSQKYAESVLIWSERSERYGLGFLLVLLIVSVLTVTIAVQLAMFRREKEIRVKLLIGAKESHVRGQFLFEGGLLGLFGGILASLAVYFFYDLAYTRLQLSYGGIFTYRQGWIELTAAGILLGGLLIGLAGSFWATRRWLHE